MITEKEFEKGLVNTKEKKEDKKHLLIKTDPLKEKSQIKIIIQGIEIYFPYGPYKPQTDYMEQVISTLNESGNISALESPTGTGKTLCLLCSVLAWVKHYNKPISIYYCSRTVSQINNVLKELNKTCYSLNISFLTSRKHTCLKFSKYEKRKMDNNCLTDNCEFLRRNMRELKMEKNIIYSEDEDEEELKKK